MPLTEFELLMRLTAGVQTCVELGADTLSGYTLLARLEHQGVVRRITFGPAYYMDRWELVRADNLSTP